MQGSHDAFHIRGVLAVHDSLDGTAYTANEFDLA